MAGELVIDVQGMTKRFGDRTVVNQIDMQVRAGEIYGFLGPNGSGKTTFIRMLCGLLRADGGSADGHLVPAESGDLDVREDIVDEIVERCLDTGAEVRFVPDGMLGDARGIAGVLRY